MSALIHRSTVGRAGSLPVKNAKPANDPINQHPFTGFLIACACGLAVWLGVYAVVTALAGL